MRCPFGCGDFTADRMRDHVFYVHGAPKCVCGCGAQTTHPRSIFATEDCGTANRRAWARAMKKLGEIKALLARRSAA